MFQPIKEIPWTCVISASALAAFCIPGLDNALQLDFELLGDGQWWRLLTGHLTHFSRSHLFWDLLMFGVLSAACERDNKTLFPWLLGLMAIGVSVSVGLFTETVTYRGLSGVDTGLFVWFALQQIRHNLNHSDRVAMALWSVPLLGLMAKLVYEASTGQTLFVESSDFTPLVESHLAGAAGGLLAMAMGNRFHTANLTMSLRAT